MKEKKYSILLLFLLLFCSEAKIEEPVLADESDKIELAQVFEEVEIEDVASKYSHIKIKDYGNVRSLYFVRDNGDIATESSMDLKNPHKLQLLYTKVMFANMLIQKEPASLLLVGLGGGSMVQFINYYYPSVLLDVCEIDPEIVRIAKKHFGLKEKENTKIYTEDIHKLLTKNQKKYDSIFMDAFLKPAEDTDSTGVANKLKEKAFFESLKQHLNPEGTVVYNINHYEGYKEDIDLIKNYFSQVYIFTKNSSGNIIVIASTGSNRVSHATMKETAAILDSSKKANFSYKTIASYYREIFP